jgi:hypothetical protein
MPLRRRRDHPPLRNSKTLASDIILPLLSIVAKHTGIMERPSDTRKSPLGTRHALYQRFETM